jgi:drug/metabolite transporter (DMT)-like permease
LTSAIPPGRAGGFAFAAAGAILFSAKAIIVKLAYRHQVDPATLIAMRMMIALPFFAAVAWWVGRRSPLAWRPADRARVVLLGLLGYYIASYLDFMGLQYISAGLERVILYLNPTLVLLISALALRRKVGRQELIALAITYLGVFVVFAHDVRLEGANVALGSALVFLSAVSYAVYLVMSGEMVRRIGPMRLTAWASIVASIACIAQSLALDAGALLSQPAPVWWLSALNGTLCTVFPVFLIMFAIDRIGPAAAAQTGMIGPVSTILLAAWILGDPVTGMQAIGTAIVLAGIFYLTRQPRRV